MKSIAGVFLLVVWASCGAADDQNETRGFDVEQKTTMDFGDGEPIVSITRIARDTAGRSRIELDGATVITDPIERVIWFADQTGRAFRHAMSEHRVELAKRGQVPPAPTPDPPEGDLPDPETVEEKKVDWNGFPAEFKVMRVTAPPDPTVGLQPLIVQTEYLVAYIEGMRVLIKMEMRSTDDRMPSVTKETTNFRQLVGDELESIFSAGDQWTVVDHPSQLSQQPTRAGFPMLPSAFFEEP